MIDLNTIGIYTGVNNQVKKISNLRAGRYGKKVITQVYAGVESSPKLVYDFLDEIECMVIVFDYVYKLSDIENDGDMWSADYTNTNKSDSELGITLTFTNPTASNPYYSSYQTYATSLGGDFHFKGYIKLKSGEYISPPSLKAYFNTHDISLNVTYQASWSSSGGYTYRLLGFTPWENRISDSYKNITHTTMNDFPNNYGNSGGYGYLTLTTTFQNFTVNGKKYPIIIMDKVKYADTNQIFWLDNKCYVFEPGMTWADFIDNSNYDRGNEFSKYTTKNLIKYLTHLEDGTYYIKDQVLSDTIQATTYELMNANELLATGTYWVIDQNGTTTYDSSGVAYAYSNNTSSWTCPIKGSYYIELHGKGGNGGSGIANFHMVNGVGQQRMSGSGGGGGGSGVRFSTSLTERETFSITWTNGTTTFTGSSIAYVCQPGTDGASGTAADPYASSVTASGGSGGARGAYTATGSSSTSILASAGSSGSRSSSTAINAVAGGAGGKGGATVGSYGNGGQGANIPGGETWAWDIHPMVSETFNGESGQPGGIIITYRS